MKLEMKAVSVAVILLTMACRQEQKAVTPPGQQGQPAAQQAQAKAPDASDAALGAYKAKWLDGSPFEVSQEKGNVVLLNVWATWCGPCRFEIPELDKLHTQYAGRGFKVVGVSIDEGGAADVKPFVDRQKIGYPIALDPEGKLATILNTTVIPTSVLIDRKGNVVWKHFGIVSTSDPLLKRALETALSAR